MRKKKIRPHWPSIIDALGPMRISFPIGILVGFLLRLFVGYFFGI